MEKLIKIGLAVLFLLCLADMPYGFFQLVRFLSVIGFGILAFDANKNSSNQTEVIVFIILAVLFQPIYKIPLGRTLWNIVDVIVAIGLLMTIFNSTNTNKKTE